MPLSEKRELVMTEYGKAQDSAEHYNQMIWVLIPVFLGFVFYLVVNYDLLNVPILEKPGLIMIGAFALFLMGVLIEGAHAKLVLKYAVCKAIEKQEGFIGQNLLVDELKIIHGHGVLAIRGLRRLFLFLFLLWSIKLVIDALIESQFTCTKSVFSTLIVLFVTVLIFYKELRVYRNYPTSAAIEKLVDARLNEVRVSSRRRRNR